MSDVFFVNAYMDTLREENAKYRNMVEDMKADMCSTNNKELANYLIAILKKYEEIV